MISRFAVDKAYYRSDNSVKPKAFLPKDGTTSVFVLDHMDHVQKVAHGQEYVGNERQPPKDILGYAQVAEDEVARVGLTCVIGEPPPFHHDLGGWPDDLEQQKVLALDLSESAVFVPA